MASSNASLTSLPTELQQHIASFLGCLDLQCLRYTSRILHNRLHLTIERLREIEGLGSEAWQHGLWACYQCLRIRPAFNFTDARRICSYWHVCRERFCVDCHLVARKQLRPDGSVRYISGDVIKINSKFYMICAACGCLMAWGEPESPKAGRCPDCFEPNTHIDVDRQRRATELRAAEEKGRTVLSPEEQVERSDRYQKLLRPICLGTWGNGTILPGTSWRIPV